jgi:hypothetical protein
MAFDESDFKSFVICFTPYINYCVDNGGFEGLTLELKLMNFSFLTGLMHSPFYERRDFAKFIIIFITISAS